MKTLLYTLIFTLLPIQAIAQAESKASEKQAIAIAHSSTESFSSLLGIEPSVEINLGAMMLGLLSSATENEEQGIAQILSGLDSIKVKVFELESHSKTSLIKSKISALAKTKNAQGYETLAKVKEDDSLVYVLAKMDKKNFKSLQVFALEDEDELVLIEINGAILMSQLGELMEHFDVDLGINGLK